MGFRGPNLCFAGLAGHHGGAGRWQQRLGLLGPAEAGEGEESEQTAGVAWPFWESFGRFFWEGLGGFGRFWEVFWESFGRIFGKFWEVLMVDLGGSIWFHGAFKGVS